MKTALIISPYFTSDNFPPLGAAYINAVLRKNGHDVKIFDLQFLLRNNDYEAYKLLRYLFHLTIQEAKVNFILNPNLLLFYLFSEDYPDFNWMLPKRKKTLIAVFQVVLEQWCNVYAKMIMSNRPQVILFTTNLANLFFSLFLAKIIKKSSLKPKIIFGGPGCKLAEVYNFLLNLNILDAVVVGEGEYTVVELLNRITLEKKIPAGIPGVALLIDRKISFVPREQTANLDALPFPDFDGFPLEDYKKNRAVELDKNKNVWLPIISARSCTYKCAFCSESVYAGSFRQRSAVSVIEEMKYQIKKYGCKYFIFADDALNCNKKWIDDFFSLLIKEKLPAKLCANLKPNKNISNVLVRKMVKAGFDLTALGVETFSQKLLDCMDKKTEVADIYMVMKTLNAQGIRTQINLLVGFSFERKEDIQETAKFFRKWRDYLKNVRQKDYMIFNRVGIIRVEPYSKMFISPKLYGVKMSKYKIPVPSEIGYLIPLLENILLRFNNGITLREKTERRLFLTAVLKKNNLHIIKT